MKKLIAGVDIGGTKIAVSIGTQQGRILSREVFSSLGGKQLKKSIQQIHQSLTHQASRLKITRHGLLGVGVGMPGVIDPKTQKILKSPNLRAWEGISLKKLLSKRFGLPVFVENDANAAALGEQFFGQGKGVDNFIYLTISTGIGGGVVISGRLVRGLGMAGEVGHMTVVKDGLPCACGKRGCLEAYSSGTAMASHVKRALKRGAKSKFFNQMKPGDITGYLVGVASNQNDSVAVQARKLAADYLGIALGNLINFLNPQKVILGGGVMQQLQHFWQPMMKAVKREAWPAAFKSCKVVVSKLGGRVGDLGAMALVLENRNKV